MLHRFFALAVLLSAELLVLLPATSQAQDLPPIPPIKRLLPPPGIEVPAEVRQELQAKLAELTWRLETLTDQRHRPDVEIFTKGVEYALRYDEFYDVKDFDKARWALNQAQDRLNSLAAGKTPWLRQTGLVVRGYKSVIDGSVQPYGLVIPENHDFDQNGPVYVWLRGRADKQTDLHFLRERSTKVGEIAPPDAIVLHPFGRHCLGYKSAGGRDVMEALNALGNGATGVRYDRNRVALMGFSMGGAGAWLLGAEGASVWCAVSPGAGFVETARYLNLKPENYPPHYEQLLWGQNDVPTMVRNLFNVPVIAYSGELDKQIQAARVMEEAYAAEGEKLNHHIGPGMGHKYHPDTLKQILAEVDAAIKQKPELPNKASVQTRTLAHPSAGWLVISGLEEHWRDARVDAEIRDKELVITTKNVTSLATRYFRGQRVPIEKYNVTIDGQSVKQKGNSGVLHAKRVDGKWQAGDASEKPVGLRKSPGLQGPIDDAFNTPILLVLPDRKSSNPRLQQWLDFEIAHFRERWEVTFRGKLTSKRGAEVTDTDAQLYHLICFGDPTCNAYIARCLAGLPLSWSIEKLELANQQLPADTHVPLMIYPNPLLPEGTQRGKYIVVNSGPTFREAHDRTNSLQNPKLPDWAIIDITTPPNGEQPGKVVAADFFDEQWQLKKPK